MKNPSRCDPFVFTVPHKSILVNWTETFEPSTEYTIPQCVFRSSRNDEWTVSDNTRWLWKHQKDHSVCACSKNPHDLAVVMNPYRPQTAVQLKDPPRFDDKFYKKSKLYFVCE